jgi:hypothetical protein
MSRATSSSGGDLNEIPDCYIKTPNLKITMKIIPDISDGKGASYGDTTAIGRSYPIKTFSHGENRTISWTANFIVCKNSDINENLKYLRAIESLVYPRTDVGSGAPYAPPPVCFLKCGNLLGGYSDSGSGGSGEICAVLKNYDVKFPPDVPWDPTTKIPYKFSVNMNWDVVYRSDDLPGQERIINKGR